MPVNDSLSSGRLDKKIVLQSRVESDDSGGGHDITYADLAPLWCALEPGSGREFTQAQQLVPQLSHMVTLRYRRGITSKHRFRYVANGQARTFAIHIVSDPLERHEQLVCYCSEVSQT